MLTDIEIAQQCTMLPIADIAERLGVLPEELEPYGRYKAKLSEGIFSRLEGRKDGKLVLVTAINPTPAGEGKTTTTVGLGQAMHRIGKNAVIALRERWSPPSTPPPPGKAKPPPPSAWDRPCTALAKTPSSPCGSPPWARCSGSRGAQPEAATPRWFPWRTSTSISPGICTPSPQPTTCSAP